MGRLFSYAEIEAGMVPSPESFVEAKELFVEEFGNLCSAGLIDGSFIFGSVAQGIAAQRSDFDALVVLHGDSSEDYLITESMSQFMREATDGKVPFVPIVHSRKALEQGFHEMDRFFGQHLQSGFRIVQGNDPATYMKFPQGSASDIFAEYVFHKKRRLSDRYHSVEPTDVHEQGLQRMLELPVAIGRKAVLAMAEVSGEQETITNSADKMHIVTTAGMLLEIFGLDDHFYKLVQADREYTGVLLEAVEGRLDKDTYEEFLCDLHEMLPHTMFWIYQVAEALLPIMKEKVLKHF